MICWRKLLTLAFATFAIGSAWASETLNYTVYSSPNVVAWTGTITIGSLDVPIAGNDPTLITAGSGSFEPTDSLVYSGGTGISWFNGGQNLSFSSSALASSYVTGTWHDLTLSPYSISDGVYNDGTVNYFVSGGSVAFSDPTAVPEIDGATLPKLLVLLGMLYLIGRSRWKPKATNELLPSALVVQDALPGR